MHSFKECKNLQLSLGLARSREKTRKALWIQAAPSNDIHARAQNACSCTSGKLTRTSTACMCRDYVLHNAHAQCKHVVLYLLCTFPIIFHDGYAQNYSYSVMQQLFLQLVWLGPLSQTPPLLSGASQPSSSSVPGIHSSPWGCVTHCTT